MRHVPSTDSMIIEAGTPLIKKFGVGIVRDIRREVADAFVIADMKTLDVGQIEARIAHEGTADGAIVSGLASKRTIDAFLTEATRFRLWSAVDMLGVRDPVRTLTSLNLIPDIVILHRSIDDETRTTLDLSMIRTIKKRVSRSLFVGIAGGLNPVKAQRALQCGADIIIVGRYVTASKDPQKAIDRLLLLV